MTRTPPPPPASSQGSGLPGEDAGQGSGPPEEYSGQGNGPSGEYSGHRARFDRSARPLILDGMMTQAMVSLAGGAFLAAFALALGASELQIGILAALPPAGQLLQVPAIVLIRKVRRRRAIALAAASVSRLIWFLVAAVPLFLVGDGALGVIALLVLLSAGAASIGGVAWMSWMRDLVPEELMGRYFSRRMMFANVLAIAVSAAGGFFVDAWAGAERTPVLAYSVLFAVGALFGLAGLLFLGRVEEPELPEMEPVSLGGLSRELTEPFREENFRHLLFFSAAWTFAITFAAPFYVVYMLETIGLPFSTVVLLSIVAQLFNVIFLTFWGEVADRFSNRSVLGAAGTILLASILGWSFTTLPDPHVLTLPLLGVIHVAMGTAMGGIALATGNIGLRLSPSGRAESYVTSLGVVNAGVAVAAPLLAGVLARFFAGKELLLALTLEDTARTVTIPTLSFRGLDFIFVITFLLGLYAMHRLAAVQEKGTVEDRVVLMELRDRIREDARSLASFGSLHQVVAFTGYVVPARVRRRLRRRSDRQVTSK